MDLQEIKRYSHRIDKIIVTNNNLYSLFEEIIFKVSLNDLYISNNEIVRFSLEENDNYIQHQRFDNDYYIRIPNKLNDVTYIYAHYFPSDLYTYDEDEEIFSVYDFNELKDIEPKDHYFNEPYTIEMDQEKYEWHIDNEGRLIVRSLLQDSINEYNDPNYKNYIEDFSNGINMTQKGFFPLSSKYRTKQNWEAPNIDNNIKPYWKEKTYANNEMPYWEVKIDKKGLTPLIAELENSNYDAFPLNVFLNYEYLPTSREYHQHYFGFESNPNVNNTECKTINVLEGTNINTVSARFGSKNNYRLINWSNPYSDDRSMYVPHGYEIPIDFNTFTPSNTTNNEPTCLWDKNICYDFWSYSANHNELDTEGYCTTYINLTEDNYYTLKYYMYIPSYAKVTNDSCYVQIISEPTDITTYEDEDDMVQYDDAIQAINSNENKVTYKLNDAFIKQDKVLRDQWIYHEIPFRAGKINQIKIIGPQTVNVNNNEDNTIFFAKMSLMAMEEYSPTLKYTNTGVYVTEQNQYAYKPASEEVCNQASQVKNNKLWETIEEKELPIPYNNIYISIDQGTYLEYDDYTGNLYFEHDDNERLKVIHNEVQKEKQYQDVKYRVSNNTAVIDNVNYNYIERKEIGASTSVINITRNDEWDNDCWYESPSETLYASYKDILVMTRSTNNKFKINIKDINNNLITNGSVHASIFKTKDREASVSAAEIDLKEKKNENGTIVWSNIDLTNLDYNEITGDSDYGNKYYLRFEYSNPCRNKTFIDFKPFYVIEEEINIDIKVNGESNIISRGYTIDDINDLPVKIEAYIKDNLNILKTDGYCELSIDDKVVQTTLVDMDGKADFYLDLEDFKDSCSTIKIEYYREYYHAISFIYFKICVDELLDVRPQIPIDVKIMNQDQTYTINNSCTIQTDDCLLCSINNNYHTEFSIIVYKNNEIFIPKRNIYAPNVTIDFFDSEYNNTQRTDTFKIITGDMVDINGEKITNKYRDYQKTFKVIRKDNITNIIVN